MLALQRYSAAMGKTNGSSGRLNIYVSREFWRRVKQAAAVRDLSVSEYCAEAIEARLEAEDSPAASTVRTDAVAAARRFREAHFGRTTFAVSTAELLRAAREEDADR